MIVKQSKNLFASRQRKSLRIFIILLVAVLFLFLINYYGAGVKNLFYYITSPVQRFFWKAGESTSGFWGTILNASSIKKEISSLTIENQELLNKLSQLQDLQKENDTLRQAMGLNLQKDYKLLFADIISQDSSQDSILIDRGLADGVEEGMPAVNQQKVLFGKVSKVYKNFARISLITSKDFVSDVKIQGKEISGVTRGQGNLSLVLDLAPKGCDLAAGDVLVTSRLGGVFPENLLVGTIKAVDKCDAKPYQTAGLEPFFDLSSGDTLFLITNFKN